MKKISHRHTFLGSATVSEKGQVVIPIEARKLLKLKKGEKLLVFGMGDSLVLSKIAQLESYAAMLSDRLSKVRTIVRTSKAR